MKKRLRTCEHATTVTHCQRKTGIKNTGDTSTHGVSENCIPDKLTDYDAIKIFNRILLSEKRQ